MKRFTQYITELFDRPFPVVMSERGGNASEWGWDWSGVFGTPSQEYEATATPSRKKNKNTTAGVVDSWDFFFTVDGRITADRGQSVKQKKKHGSCSQACWFYICHHFGSFR